MSLQQQLLVFVSAFAAGDGGAIHLFQLDPQLGRLTHVRRTTDAEHPFFLALSPDRKYLYAIHAPGKFGGDRHEQVSAYRIDGRDGRLTRINRQSTLGTGSCYLDVDATGRAVAANYSSGSVVSLPVLEDGSLGQPATVFQHVGMSVNPQRQDASHAHCSVISPDNRFVYVADLGLDQVLGYRLDSQTAQLSPGSQPFVRTRPGAGPRHLTFHPNGQLAYVINEIGNSVTVFNYDPATGVLIERQTVSTLPQEFTGTSHTADVKITPNGRFLYGTNRGHDSIVAYKINDNGQLSRVEIVSSQGQGPQNLAITPGGELLLCANMSSGTVVAFRIDRQTGKLSPVGQPIVVPNASCIMILKPSV